MGMISMNKSIKVCYAWEMGVVLENLHLGSIHKPLVPPDRWSYNFALLLVLELNLSLVDESKLADTFYLHQNFKHPT